MITLGVSGNIFINPEFWSVSCELIYIYTASPDNRQFSKLTDLDVSVHLSCSRCAVSEGGV